MRVLNLYSGADAYSICTDVIGLSRAHVGSLRLHITQTAPCITRTPRVVYEVLQPMYQRKRMKLRLTSLYLVKSRNPIYKRILGSA